jgi:hypothetical protein
MTGGIGSRWCRGCDCCCWCGGRRCCRGKSAAGSSLPVAFVQGCGSRSAAVLRLFRSLRAPTVLQGACRSASLPVLRMRRLQRLQLQPRPCRILHAHCHTPRCISRLPTWQPHACLGLPPVLLLVRLALQIFWQRRAVPRLRWQSFLCCCLLPISLCCPHGGLVDSVNLLRRRRL